MNNKNELYQTARLFFARIKHGFKNYKNLSNMNLDELEREYIFARGIFKYSINNPDISTKRCFDDFSIEEQKGIDLVISIRFGTANEIQTKIDASEGMDLDLNEILLWSVLYGRCEAITYFLQHMSIDVNMKFLLKMYALHDNPFISRGGKHATDIINLIHLNDKLSTELKPKIETSKQPKKIKI